MHALDGSEIIFRIYKKAISATIMLSLPMTLTILNPSFSSPPTVRLPVKRKELFYIIHVFATCVG